MTIASVDAPLKRTPLHALHGELAARMVPFAGYEMPVQYPNGILKEHLHVRAAAGLFDVSHMGQFEIRSLSGRAEDAARALESVVPMDLLGLASGRQRYALLTNEQGGIRDDLMIARLGDRFLIVANAACKDADEIYLREMLSKHCEIERRDDLALLALQGPLAEAVLTELVPTCARCASWMCARSSCWARTASCRARVTQERTVSKSARRRGSPKRSHDVS